MTNVTSIESDDGIERLKHACSRVLELAVSVWLERAQAIVGNRPTTWASFLDRIGMNVEDVARYGQELDRARASGEVLPWPPMPKSIKLKRTPLQDKLDFIAIAIIRTLASASEPLPIHEERTPAVTSALARAQPAPTPSVESRVQRVYFIQGVDGGPIKIGVSSDPDERLSTLQTASPTKLRIVGLVAGGPSLERALHVRLAAHRLHGEWFSDAPEVMAAIGEALS